MKKEIHFKNHTITIPLEPITENYALYYDKDWKGYFIIHLSTGFSLTGYMFNSRDRAIEICHQAEKHLPFNYDVATYNQRWQHIAIENSEVKEFVEMLQNLRYDEN